MTGGRESSEPEPPESRRAALVQSSRLVAVGKTVHVRGLLCIKRETRQRSLDPWVGASRWVGLGLNRLFFVGPMSNFSWSLLTHT